MAPRVLPQLGHPDLGNSPLRMDFGRDLVDNTPPESDFRGILFLWSSYLKPIVSCTPYKGSEDCPVLRLRDAAGSVRAMNTRIGIAQYIRASLKLSGLVGAILGLFVTVGTFSVQAAREKHDLIVLIPGETVYLEVIQNTVRSYPGFSWTDSGENDRFFKLGQALEDAFAKRKVPLKIKVVVFGTDIPDGATKVSLALIRWDRGRLGEIEARFIAELKKGGSKENLGVFIGTEQALPVRSVTIAERQYQAAAEKAASKFADRMNLQINF